MEEGLIKAERERKRRAHCIACGKPTRSHRPSTGEYLCHRCWMEEGRGR